MKHELKTDPEVFEAVWARLKSYEIRFNDRDYREGDILLLKETKHAGAEMATGGKPLEYTGREISVEAKHVLRGPCYGLKEGWCIISIMVIMRDNGRGLIAFQ